MYARIQRGFLAALLSLAIATPALAATPAVAPVDEPFAALLGVQAEQLAAAEMDAIHGALTGQELFDRLLSSAQLIRDPVLRQRVVDHLNANQAALVAFFNRLLSWRR